MGIGTGIILLIIPVAVGLLSAIPKSPGSAGIIGFFGSVIYGTIWAIYSIAAANTVETGLFYIDKLSALAICLVSAISVISSAFSIGYIRREQEHGLIRPTSVRRYYLLYHTFIAAMYASLCFNSLGLTWVAIEVTTLVSAALVGLYGKKLSLEAAWKYLAVCSLGIAFALFGLVLLHQAGRSAGLESALALNWTDLMAKGGYLDRSLVGLAFIFLLVGYGTKAGLAPMHTWLPDAHSQAPSPVSATLSGVLLNCALIALIRTAAIAAAAVRVEFTSNLLIAFGIISLLVAAPLMLVQRELKRLLAYSSIENIGIITLGLGLGFVYKGTAAIAFAHMIYHSLGKTVLFLAAGAAIQGLHTKRILKMRGMLAWDITLGFVFILGMAALAGVPPFGPFSTEFGIAAMGFSSERPFVTAAMLLLLGAAFAAFAYHGTKMLLGRPSARAAAHTAEHLDRVGIAALLIPLAAILILGIYMPDFLKDFLTAAAAGLHL